MYEQDDDPGFLMQALGWLGAPKRFVVGGMDRLLGGSGDNTSVEDLLVNHGGMDRDSFLTKALGFGGDMLADPTTYLLPWAAGKVAGRLFPRAAEAATAASKGPLAAALEGTPSYATKPINVLDNALPAAAEAPLQLGYQPYAPPFYSRLTEAVQGAKQEAMPGSQWLNYLKGKGIKDEEIDLLGRGLFGGNKVSRAELLAAESPVNKISVFRRPESDYSAWSGFTEKGGGDYSDILATQKGNPYFGPHWQTDPGVFAHLRTTKRGPVTFGEEIQSDLHQAARKTGYQGTPKADEFVAKGQQARQQINDLTPILNAKASEAEAARQALLGAPGDAALQARYEGLNAELEQIRGTMREAVGGLAGTRTAGTIPPPAPYAEAWPLFMLKNLLRQGAEQGSERVAWNTGQRMANLVGGDLAGQQEFYDKIMPAIANKYVKKWGVKVEPTALNFSENPHLADLANVHSIPITPAMRQELLWKGQPLMMAPLLAALYGLNNTDQN